MYGCRFLTAWVGVRDSGSTSFAHRLLTNCFLTCAVALPSSARGSFRSEPFRGSVGQGCPSYNWCFSSLSTLFFQGKYELLFFKARNQFLIYFLVFIEIQLIYSVVLVSGVQQSDSCVYISIYSFLDSFTLQVIIRH